MLEKFFWVNVSSGNLNTPKFSTQVNNLQILQFQDKRKIMKFHNFKRNVIPFSYWNTPI